MCSSPIHVAPFGALRFYGARNHGFTPVYTRGYNMPSRRDYKGGTTNTLGKSGQRLRNLEYASFAEPKATISQK